VADGRLRVSQMLGYSSYFMESVSNVGVLDKAVHVVRAIEEFGPQTLLDLQASTGLPRATLHRLAVALETHGLLRREGSGRFCLGLGLVALGAAAAAAFPIAGLARPRLMALCQHTGESVQLYVREGDRRRCAVSLPSPHGLRWIVSEGALLPLHLGSAGRVLSGELSGLGWIETVEEREPGVASVSAPVARADTGILAAVSIGGPVERMTRRPGSRFGPEVAAAASEIAATL
jgi:DNA-binding IclR family transcriptional regulator